jgi:hypothetical protein
VQSEGHHRQLRAGGAPRLLEDADQRAGRPRVVFNPEELIIRSALPNVEPPAELAAFWAAQAVLDERGKHQRGITTGRDAGKYPLSTRVYDLCCGYPMYGRTSGERRCYTCGRYVNSSGDRCAHNQVDAEAALRFVLGVLKQKLVACGGRDAIRERIERIAKAAGEQRADRAGGEAEVLAARLGEAEEHLQLLTTNMGRATEAAAFAAIQTQFLAK